MSERERERERESEKEERGEEGGCSAHNECTVPLEHPPYRSASMYLHRSASMISKALHLSNFFCILTLNLECGFFIAKS